MPSPVATAQVRVVVNLDVDAEKVHTVADRLADALCTALDGQVATSVSPVLRTLPTLPPDVAPLRIWTRRRVVELHGTPLELTRLEYDLLLFFCTHPHVVHTRTDLMTQVWGLPGHPSSRTVDVHVRRLRTKLGAGVPLLTTVRGVGYRVDDTGIFDLEEAVPVKTAVDAAAS